MHAKQVLCHWVAAPALKLRRLHTERDTNERQERQRQGDRKRRKVKTDRKREIDR